ncbi:DUF2145 domain-containing protein [Spongorhabdus nitratireducens]
MKALNSCFAVLLFSFSVLSHGGSAQTEDAVYSVEQIEAFAKSVEKYAAKKGAQVFILGRVGRNPADLPNGINFTHTAIGVYSTITLASGEKVNGYAIHNLYQVAGQLDRSELVVDYPVDFFWGVNALRAGIVIPTAELQQRIMKAIATGVPARLHNGSYSVIANPFSQDYQNCTEHTLDVINASIYQTTDIAQLKVNSAAHFDPQHVDVSPVKRMLGNWFVDDVSTDDHDGEIYTATLTTIAKYLDKNKLLTDAVYLHADGSSSRLY